jgi:hypothetical protein
MYSEAKINNIQKKGNADLRKYVDHAGLNPDLRIGVYLNTMRNLVCCLEADTTDLDDTRKKSQLTPFPLNSIRLLSWFLIMLVIGSLEAGFIQVISG